MQLTSDILNPSLKIFLNSLGFLVLLISYAVLWGLLWELSHAFWYLPAGLRFVTLMYTRRAYWPVILLAEWLAIVYLNAQYPGVPGVFEQGLGYYAPSIIYAGVLGLWLKRRDWTALAVITQGELVKVALAIVVSALLAATSLFLFLPADSPFLIFEKFSTRGVLSYALGDVAGMLFFLSAAEFIKALLTMKKTIRLVFFKNAALIIFPVTAVITLLTPTFEWAFLALMFLPIVFLALKHGWPGATFSLLVLNVVAGLSFWLSGNTVVLFDTQIFLVSVGFTGLFLGAVVTQQTELMADINKISQRMIAAQETERNRISRDLHDHIGQVLTALTLRSAIIKRQGPNELRAELDLLDKLAAQAFHDVRVIVNELSPIELSHSGLERSLKGAAIRKMLEASNIKYSTSIDGLISEAPEDVQFAIFRISQEALSNIAKHSLASECSLKVALSNDPENKSVRLEIRDNGKGFDLASVNNGHGLQNMSDRVLALTGSCTFSSDESGTLVKITLPI